MIFTLTLSNPTAAPVNFEIRTSDGGTLQTVTVDPRESFPVAAYSVKAGSDHVVLTAPMTATPDALGFAVADPQQALGMQLLFLGALSAAVFARALQKQ